MCVCVVCERMPDMGVEVGGKLVGVGFLFLPHESQGLNSGSLIANAFTHGAISPTQNFIIQELHC